MLLIGLKFIIKKYMKVFKNIYHSNLFIKCKLYLLCLKLIIIKFHKKTKKFVI